MNVLVVGHINTGKTRFVETVARGVPAEAVVAYRGAENTLDPHASSATTSSAAAPTPHPPHRRFQAFEYALRCARLLIVDDAHFMRLSENDQDDRDAINNEDALEEVLLAGPQAGTTTLVTLPHPGYCRPDHRPLYDVVILMREAVLSTSRRLYRDFAAGAFRDFEAFASVVDEYWPEAIVIDRRGNRHARLRTRNPNTRNTRRRLTRKKERNQREHADDDHVADFADADSTGASLFFLPMDAF